MSLSLEEIAELVYTSDNAVVELRLFTAVAALGFFDYCLTLTREVEHIWKREFSTPVVLFYLVRYPAVISASNIFLYLTGWRGISDKGCSILIHVGWILNILTLSAAAMFSALRACALCWKDKRVFAFVLLLACVNPAITAYTFVKLNISYVTSPVRGCVFAPDMPDAVYENWTIGARLSAVLTDMVVLVITIWKARPVRVQGVKLGVRSTVASILMRDGVLYFGVLLITNLIGLIIVRFFAFIQPINTWIAMLTTIMTSRFILDLREAADPRHYDDLSTNSGGISTLVFPTTSQHTPCFDSNPCLGTNAACSAGGDDTEREPSRAQSLSQSCPPADVAGRGIMGSRCSDEESVIWIR